MEPLLTHCAALDVHKANVQACMITPDANDKPQMTERKFSTSTDDLQTLREWLKAAQDYSCNTGE
jgi:transposase